MIAFGGRAGGALPNTGSLYDPVGDTWVATSTGGRSRDDDRSCRDLERRLPTSRGERTRHGRAGGTTSWHGPPEPHGRFGSPATRSGHSGVWASEQFIVWGGTAGAAVLGDGGDLASPTRDLGLAHSARLLRGTTARGIPEREAGADGQTGMASATPC